MPHNTPFSIHPAILAGCTLLSLLAACATPDGGASLEESPTASNELAITDGHDFGPNDELPKYTVSFERCFGPNDCKPTCTGTIVRSNWILTAAHCLVGPDETIHFYSGGQYSSDTRRVAEVRFPEPPAAPDYVTPHKYLPSGQRWDLVLVRMDRPIPLGTQYKAAFITLNPGGIDPVVDKQGWVVGAGLHEGRLNDRGTLKWSDARVTNFGASINTLVSDAKVNSNDSGGGFFTWLGNSSSTGMMELVAVTSALDTASAQHVATYLGRDDVRTWIASIILN